MGIIPVPNSQGWCEDQKALSVTAPLLHLPLLKCLQQALPCGWWQTINIPMCLALPLGHPPLWAYAYRLYSTPLKTKEVLAFAQISHIVTVPSPKSSVAKLSSGGRLQPSVVWNPLRLCIFLTTQESLASQVTYSPKLWKPNDDSYYM